MPKRKKILIDAIYPEETRVVIIEDNLVQEFDYETATKRQIKGNIYLAKVTRVEPSLQAAFIDYGEDKHGFLPFSEIHPDYYHIPVSDRASEGDGADEEGANALNERKDNIGLQIKALTPPDLTSEDTEEEIIPEQSEPIEDSIITNEENLENNILPIGIDDNIDFPESEVIDFPAEDHLDDSSRYIPLFKHYKIQEVIKRNQIILVQAIKEERGNKGASFTSFISLAGRYCVLMPNSPRQGGISRRIVNPDDKRRLKAIIDNLNITEGASIIVRTAGSGRSKAEIKRDYDYLVRLWNGIRDHTLSASAPAFIHAEGDLLKRTIRDLYDNSFDEILIQGEPAYKASKELVKMIIPNHIAKVKQYKSKVPIFSKYQIEEQLSALYNPIATLSSGGYIVINPTEALISIDVNSGRSTSERNIEETALKTNIEAAHEVARQLKLRDLSGLIVIDFIDMMEMRNRRIVEKELRDMLQFDKAKVQIGSISSFGLLEMSRQRLRPSFIESNTISCPYCSGKGSIRAPESNALMILRTIENEICKGDYEKIHVYANPDVIIHLMNHKRNDISSIESRYNTTVMMHSDPQPNHDSFGIEKDKRTNKQFNNSPTPINVAPEYYVEPIEEEVEIVPEKTRKKNWRNNKIDNDGNTNEKLPHLQTMSDEFSYSGKKKSRASSSRYSSRDNKREGQKNSPKNDITDTNNTSSEKPTSGNRKKRASKGYRERKLAAVNAENTSAKRDVKSESLIKGLLKRILD